MGSPAAVVPAASRLRSRLPAASPAAAALGAGFAGWAAHPPVGGWWLGFAVVPLVLSALRGLAGAGRAPAAIAVRAGAVGVVAGLAAFVPLLAWVRPAAGVAAWLLLAAVQAGWYGAAAVVLRRWAASKWIVVVAPAVWVGMETARNTVPLGGFGWGGLAYAHTDASWFLPVARLAGASGVAFVTVLVGVGVQEVLRRAAPLRGWRAAVRAAGMPAAVVVAAAALPAGVPDAPPPGRTADVVVVQGNDLDGFAGTVVEEDRLIAARLVEQTRAATASGGAPDLVVWPESSMNRDPFTPTGADLRPFLTEGAAAAGGKLLVGTNLDGPQPAATFFNAAVVVDAAGLPTDEYVKRRLVPFGEYLPLRGLLGGVPPFAEVLRDGIPGSAARTLVVGGVRVAPAICYETLFAELVRGNVRAGGAEIVVAITNDASYGKGAMSAQHLAQSRLRAVETGRWVVHAALSGHSALAGPDGRLHARTALFERATVRVDVPRAHASTPFLTIGDVVGRGSAAVLVALLAAPLVRRVRRGRAAAEEGDRRT